MSKEQCLATIKEFAEGRLAIRDFEKICKESKEMRELVKDHDNANIGFKFNFEMLRMIDECDWGNFMQQADLIIIFSCVLYDNNVRDFKETDFYIKRAYKFSDVIPDWLSDDAIDYVQEKIIDVVPENLSDKDKKKWIKDQIKKTFRYEKRPPEFAQSGEWPLDDEGKPLVFRKQKTRGEQVTYTFVNPKDNKETEVMELY